jgi:hypothetical protein
MRGRPEWFESKMGMFPPAGKGVFDRITDHFVSDPEQF